MSSEGVLRRHNEIRTALRFFVDSWYKNKIAGTSADKNQVMFDYLKFKGVLEVAQHLHAPAPQVFRKEDFSEKKERYPRNSRYEKTDSTDKSSHKK
eukprot:CAMPEP_0175074982 /NCGR_PEP_ID=MMETSP0052_2-20121109/21681_1 /TAXON_ID=51329 ORGANISM="Polytomella parva, Strain SAG 63-3" /NCGR_SAMPLE_ID=MMETSP0052_2 /ASSEMBLY_ACC=CAM_ASM_000194 /LENGTH=95 /DNA_ID=CAMNT_0016343485 /DNA_START=41 /DNA_END=328 /DNA_ORIENTATION=+